MRERENESTGVRENNGYCLSNNKLKGYVQKDYAYIITSHYSYIQGKGVCTNYVVALLLLILFASIWQTNDKSCGTRKTNYTVVLNNCTLSLFCNEKKNL